MGELPFSRSTESGKYDGLGGALSGLGESLGCFSMVKSCKLLLSLARLFFTFSPFHFYLFCFFELVETGGC